MNKRETKHFDIASEICILHSSLNQLKSTTHNGELYHLSDQPHYSKGPQNLPKHQRSQ